MKLSMQIGYSGGFAESVAQVQALEKAGMDIVYVAEAYGYDAPTLMGYLAAETETIQIASGILPIYTRTPTLLAMTAAGLDELSGGRAVLGLGASGPQVIEGFHGVPYDAPIGRTREIIDICRKVWKREEPVVHDGKRYQLPLPEGQGTGLGKPLKITLKADPNIPIYLAAIGPKNVELAAEIADGWLPIFFSPQHYAAAYQEQVTAGLAKAGGRNASGKSLENFDIAATVPVVVGDNVEECRNMVKPFVALYVGGMGAKGKNFYFDLACRFGYEAAAHRIQEAYLAGDKGAAMAHVPDALVDEVALVGPKQRLAERLELWRNSPITTLNVSTFDIASVRVMAELVL